MEATRGRYQTRFHSPIGYHARARGGVRLPAAMKMLLSDEIRRAVSAPGGSIE